MKEVLESLQLIDSTIDDSRYELTKNELDKNKIFDLLKVASREVKILINKTK